MRGKLARSFPSWIVGLSNILVLQSTCLAAGFQLVEENVAGLGLAHADWAVNGNDASSAYYNAAALSDLKHHQLVLSLTNINTEARFVGSGSVSYFDPAMMINTWNEVFASTTGGQESKLSKSIPEIYLAGPINDKWSYGIGLAVPFGLETNWAETSVVRYSATLSRVQVLNYTASVSYHPTTELSVAAGIDKQRMSAVFAQTIFNMDQTMDTLTKNSGVSWGYGWHAGFVYRYTPATKIGFSYHSQVAHELNGRSESIEVGPNAIGMFGGNSTIQNTVTRSKLPATTAFSLKQKLTDRSNIYGSVIHTKWSVFKDLRVQRVNINGLSQTVAIHEGFHNTWSFALGGDYRVNDKWLIRAGVGMDNPPTDTSVRNIRLPDERRYQVAVGAHYQLSKRIGIDAGYSHFFIRNAALNNTIEVQIPPTTSARINVNGRVHSSADVAGIQLTWDIA